MSFVSRLDEAKQSASKEIRKAAVGEDQSKGQKSVVTSILSDWREKMRLNQESLLAEAESKGPPPRRPSERLDSYEGTSPDEVTGNEWTRFVDEATGYPYYYNSSTGESHWAAAEETHTSNDITEFPQELSYTYETDHQSKPYDSQAKYTTMNETDIAHDAEHDNDDDDDEGEITLLDKCSEYLFDIFESNLTPEYQRINDVQEMAVQSFLSSSDLDARPDHKQVYEYTFAQEQFHQQFCSTFEKLITEFLRGEGESIDDFVEKLKIIMTTAATSTTTNKQTNKQKRIANEIIDCITWYSSFTSWAESMREEARYRKRCDNTPVVDLIGDCPSPTSKIHRLDAGKHK